MPVNDDATVPNDAILLRLLLKDWITTKHERRRPTSHAFRDSNAESSCFIDSEAIRAELRRLYPGFEVAAVPAYLLRQNGFAIERRPEEVSEEFTADRRAHVVVGPPQACARNVQERMARAVVQDERVTMFSL
jgi:hypothetical protein